MSFKSRAGVFLLVGLVLAALLQVGCSSESKEKVLKTATITFDNTEWTLSTPDANKDKHAHFLLEFGWVNEDRATDPQATNPTSYSSADGVDLYINIHTDSGGRFFFMRPLGEWMSYEENGITKYKWIVELDVGAKNEPSNPINYQITVNAREMGNLTPPENAPDYYDVWLDGNIAYVPFP